MERTKEIEIANNAMDVIEIDQKIHEVNKELEKLAQTLKLRRELREGIAINSSKVHEIRERLNTTITNSINSMIILYQKSRKTKRSKRIDNGRQQIRSGIYRLKTSSNLDGVEESFKGGIQVKLELELESRRKTAELIEQIRKHTKTKFQSTLNAIESLAKGKQIQNQTEKEDLNTLTEKYKQETSSKEGYNELFTEEALISGRRDKSIAISILYLLSKFIRE